MESIKISVHTYTKVYYTIQVWCKRQSFSPAVNDDWGCAIRTVHSDFPSECQQWGGVDKSPMVRPAGKVELFHNTTAATLKLKCMTGHDTLQL